MKASALSRLARLGVYGFDAVEPVILAALVTIYIVLGVLYESYIHPITILSTLPSAGVGAILAASAELFTTLKWIGAAYLIYLGIELWRAPLSSTVAAVEREYHPFEIVARGFTVNVVHPKGLAFYSAFLPQFISPEVPALPQMLILATIFIAIASSILVTHTFAAARFRSVIVQPRVRRLANRAGAICLIGAGFYTLTLNQGG